MWHIIHHHTNILSRLSLCWLPFRKSVSDSIIYDVPMRSREYIIDIHNIVEGGVFVETLRIDRLVDIGWSLLDVVGKTDKSVASMMWITFISFLFLSSTILYELSSIFFVEYFTMLMGIFHTTWAVLSTSLSLRRLFLTNAGQCLSQQMKEP